MKEREARPDSPPQMCHPHPQRAKVAGAFSLGELPESGRRPGEPWSAAYAHWLIYLKRPWCDRVRGLERLACPQHVLASAASALTFPLRYVSGHQAAQLVWIRWEKRVIWRDE